MPRSVLASSLALCLLSPAVFAQSSLPPVSNGTVQETVPFETVSNETEHPAIGTVTNANQPPIVYETTPPPEATTAPQPAILSNGGAPWATSPALAYPNSATQWTQLALPQAQSVGAWAEEQVGLTSTQLQNRLLQAQSEGKPYVLWVNVPSFTLRVFDSATGNLVMTSRVIVGASGTQTPIFDTNVVNLKFNPDWSPPPSLQRKGKRYVPPGPNNPLGQVRFSTDNSQNIYLHDTNHHELFERDMRALSAGCVRVNQWHQLAQVLSGQDAQAVDGYTEGNKIQYVHIAPSLVYISYQRVDLDEQGRLSVFPDVYRRQPLPLAPVPAQP